MMVVVVVMTMMMKVPFHVCLPKNCKQQFLVLLVSVSLSIWNNLAPTQQSAMKFYTEDCY